MKKLLLPTNAREGRLHPELSNRIVGADIDNRAPQALPSQDKITSDGMMKFLEEVITRVRPRGRLANKIYEAILAIDSELTQAPGAQYRQLLVKAAYALRNLEEGIQRLTN